MIFPNTNNSFESPWTADMRQRRFEMIRYAMKSRGWKTRYSCACVITEIIKYALIISVYAIQCYFLYKFSAYIVGMILSYIVPYIQKYSYIYAISPDYIKYFLLVTLIPTGFNMTKPIADSIVMIIPAIIFMLKFFIRGILFCL